MHSEQNTTFVRYPRELERGAEYRIGSDPVEPVFPRSYRIASAGLWWQCNVFHVRYEVKRTLRVHALDDKKALLCLGRGGSSGGMRLDSSFLTTRPMIDGVNSEDEETYA